MTKEQFKEECSKLMLSTMQNMGTAKFYILISSSLFFWFEKLDQTTWLTAVLTVAGLTNISAVAEILKGSKDKTVTKETHTVESTVPTPTKRKTK